MTSYFDHEKLIVYQEAIKFIAWSEEFSQTITKNVAAKDQMDRAATSIALNIAEGNGKFSVKDRCRFFSIACGSAVECAACLDVFVARRLASDQDIKSGKERLRGIVSMLVVLMNKLSERVREDGVEYAVE
jgi:four helix bundle protein